MSMLACVSKQRSENNSLCDKNVSNTIVYSVYLPYSPVAVLTSMSDLHITRMAAKCK